MLSLVRLQGFSCIGQVCLCKDGVLLRPIAKPSDYVPEALASLLVTHYPVHLILLLTINQNRWWQVPLAFPMVGGELGHVEHWVERGKPPSELQTVAHLTHTLLYSKRTNKTLPELRAIQQLQVASA